MGISIGRHHSEHRQGGLRGSGSVLHYSLKVTWCQVLPCHSSQQPLLQGTDSNATNSMLHVLKGVGGNLAELHWMEQNITRTHQAIDWHLGDIKLKFGLWLGST